MNNKISFITELLNSKKIEASQKERLFLLTASEINKKDGRDEKIFAEIEAIKRQLAGIENNEVEINTKIEKEIVLHKPLETSKFLQSLSSDENPLKFLIHDKTDGFNYQEMQKKWNDILIHYKTYFTANIKKTVIARMKAFVGIGTTKDWFFKGKPIKFKLTNNEVVDWCKKNPGKHPILHFDNEISYFKETIKISKGTLQKIIEEILLEKFGNDYSRLKLEFVDLDKPEFYTDVDALIAGLKNIFNSLKQRIDQSNSIKICFKPDRTSEGIRLRIIKIIHINSECDKPLTKEEIFGTDSGGDFKEAEQRFLQNCDWSIIAKNTDEEYNKLNILYDFTDTEIKPREKINPDAIEGFTHILTFYS